MSGRYSEATDLTDAVLVVEGKKLHVAKVLLMMTSPVFKAMFSGEFKEAKTSEVNLAGKKLLHVIWLLDYLHPEVPFNLSDSVAAKLLPLAEEYQINTLKGKCVGVLMKQEVPRLELISLAQRYRLSNLLDASIDACAQKLSVAKKTQVYTHVAGFGHRNKRQRVYEYLDTMELHPDTIDAQLKLPENADISNDILIRIYRKKIELVRAQLKNLPRDKTTPYEWL